MELIKIISNRKVAENKRLTLFVPGAGLEPAQSQ